MAAQINPPGIHAVTTEGQIAQIKSYLLQLARQLQYEFDKLNPIAVENTAEQDLLTSVHPSPLSASRGFFGSKPFSKINNFLISVNKKPIDWQIENI